MLSTWAMAIRKGEIVSLISKLERLVGIEKRRRSKSKAKSKKRTPRKANGEFRGRKKS